MASKWSKNTIINTLNPRHNVDEYKGTIEEITSVDGSVTVVDPFGPVTDLSVAATTSNVETWVGDATTTPEGLHDTAKDPPTATANQLSDDNINFFSRYEKDPTTATIPIVWNTWMYSSNNGATMTSQMPNTVFFTTPASHFQSSHGVVFPDRANPVFNAWPPNWCFNWSNDGYRWQFPIKITAPETQEATIEPTVYQSGKNLGPGNSTNRNHMDPTRSLWAQPVERSGFDWRIQAPRDNPFNIQIPTQTSFATQIGARLGMDNLWYDKECISSGGMVCSFVGKLSSEAEDANGYNFLAGTAMPTPPVPGATLPAPQDVKQPLPLALYGYSGVYSATPQGMGGGTGQEITILCDSYADENNNNATYDETTSGFGTVSWRTSVNDPAQINPGVWSYPLRFLSRDGCFCFTPHKFRTFKQQSGADAELAGYGLASGITPWPEARGPFADKNGDPGWFQFGVRGTGISIMFDSLVEANNKPTIEFGIWVVSEDDNGGIPPAGTSGRYNSFITIATLQYPTVRATAFTGVYGTPLPTTKYGFNNCSVNGVTEVDGNFPMKAMDFYDSASSLGATLKQRGIFMGISQTGTTDFGNYGACVPSIRCTYDYNSPSFFAMYQLIDSLTWTMRHYRHQ